MEKVKEKEVIQYEVAQNGVATIWLNRPHKRNCVSPQLLKELEAAVDRASEDKEALAVVFRGRANTFCSGADLDLLGGPVLQETTSSLQLAIDSARTYDKIFNMKKPTIAAVEGYAVAGGFELMISCDFALAASEAKIGDFHRLFPAAWERPVPGQCPFPPAHTRPPPCRHSAPGRVRQADPGLLRTADRQESVLHVDDQDGREPRTGCRHQFADHAGNDDLQRRAPFG